MAPPKSLELISGKFEQFDFKPRLPIDRLRRLKRDEIVALNSTLLHELYFCKLAATARPARCPRDAIAKDFGSVDRWRQEFVGDANGLAGGSGWCCFTYVPVTDGSSTRSRRTMTRASQGASLYLRSICTSTRTTWNLARTPALHCRIHAHIELVAVKLRYECNQGRATPSSRTKKQFADVPRFPVESQEMLQWNVSSIIDTRPKHYTTKRKISWRELSGRSRTPG